METGSSSSAEQQVVPEGHTRTVDPMTGETVIVRNRAEPFGGERVGILPFKINVPDLRNGSLVNIQQAAPRSSMSVLYHWPVITNLTAAAHVPAVEYVIRANYAQLMHVSGENVTEALAAELRKKAIVLGAIRAGAAGAIKLTGNDLTRDELVPAGMEYELGKIGQAANGTTAAGRWTVAKGMADLDVVEQSVVAACVYIGMAVPALQGVSLVMTGHHYIPTTYNLFKGIKKQALGSAAPGVSAWIVALGETFDDMAFHKACHPVMPILKRGLAKNVSVRERLRASGHGSAAIRLPAVPSEASGGKAAIALARSASSTFEQMGHSLSIAEGEALMLKLEHAAEGQIEADACNAVVAWVLRNSGNLAFCAGIVQQVHDTSGTGKNTLLSAFSVKRLVADYPAQAARGATYARAATAKMRKDLEEGTFADPAMTM